MWHYAVLSGFDFARKLIEPRGTWGTDMLFSAIRAHSEKMTDYPTDNLRVFHLPLFFKRAILEPTRRCAVKVRNIFKCRFFKLVSFFFFFPFQVRGNNGTWPKSDLAKRAVLCVYRSDAVTEAAFHALFTRCVMLPSKGLQDSLWRRRVVEVARGSRGWCGATLSLLTAHLSHFVSDCIHLGPSPVMFAGGCRASVFISCPKAM